MSLVPEIIEDSAESSEEKEQKFVHLHLHTSYSLLDAAILPKKLVGQLQKLGMKTAAITDRGNMYGVIDYYKAFIGAGLKPILGVETYMAEKDHTSRSEKRNYHLVLLAENNTGYENLCELMSIANLEGFYRKPRIDRELLEKHKEGIIGLSACLSGEIPAAILDNRLEDARRIAKEYKEIFGKDNFYLEIQENGIPKQEKVNKEIVKISKELDLPLVATNDVHYLTAEDYDVHDTLLCIGKGKLKQDPSRMRYDTDSLYLKSEEEMIDMFIDYPEAIENTVKIANRCNVELTLGKPRLPAFDIPEGYDQASYFEKLTWEGFEERVSKLPYEIDREVYEKRLKFEMDVIKGMDFPGYFLIVADFIKEAKKMEIPVGPGRGSGAGSLVAYSLKITDLDPIPFNLLFERFLNPDRISMPDFDIDFCMNRRDEIIDYVTDKYGHDRVAQIITFGSLKARGVVRDVCRAFDIPLIEADKIAKLVPEGPKSTLDSALEEEPRLVELIGTSNEYSNMYKTAQRLEGLARHTGVHAAGLVIADQPIWKYTPVIKAKDSHTLVTQYAKDEVEDVGLVKFDFLGLRTLTVIDEAVKLINRFKSEEDKLVIEDIPIADSKVYNLISSGDTNGVFQMESGGFQGMLKKLRPDRFEDIILAVAIYRPGPMDNIPLCVDRKHGREQIQYVDPVLEPILNETYGLIIYQEQVMQIAGEMAGFTMAQADTLRKAMGKKKAKLMAEMLEKFDSGAAERGFNKDVIEKVRNDMIEFAKYGFNKSHAAAYALISYQTAYLKTYYPTEFMAATLTCEIEHPDKVIKFVQETKQINIEMMPPSVQHSIKEFSVEDGKIRYGLGAVKGVGGGAIEAIIEAREEEPFKSIYHFCEIVDLKRINKRTIEALVKAGAFDFSDRPRSTLLAALEKGLDAGHAKQREREVGQTNLMDMFSAGGDEGTTQTVMAEDYPDVPDWTEKERLDYEMEALGLYLSAHPMDRYANEAKRYTKTSLSKVHELEHREEVTIAGIVTNLSDRPTRDGKGRMAMFGLQDSEGSVDCLVFKRSYNSCVEFLDLDEPILATGNIMIDGEGDEAVAKLGVKKLQPLVEVMKSNSKRVHFTLPSNIDRDKLVTLSQTMENFSGDSQVIFHFKKEGDFISSITLPNKWRINPSAEMFDNIEMLLGSNSVTLE